MKKTINKKTYNTKEKIEIFFKPLKSIILQSKTINYKQENGSITLESALTMPVIVMAICTILFAVNIGMNYMKIQDIAQTCSHIIQSNENTEKCLKINSVSDKKIKITINDSNDYTEIKVKKDIFFFPNLIPVTLETKSIIYK